MKGITAAAFALFATMASAANITIERAFPTDIAGNPIQVQLGGSFYMTAKLNVDAPLNGTYQVRFDLPYASRTTSNFTFGGEATVTWGPYTALLDGALPVKVSVLSSSDQPGQALTLTLNPMVPSQSIEFFDPKPLAGGVGALATLSSGTASGLQWYAPMPTSAGFQQLIAVSKQGAVVNSTPFGQPVDTLAKVDSVSVQFNTIASSSRVNSSILRAVPFSAYNSLPASASVWLRAETLIEARSSDISNFVSKSLPKNYRTAMKPYDAAQALFQATVAHMQYVTTTVRPDAVVAVRTGRGDCGYFAALFVASCRTIGIPARTVSGMSVGTNDWHVWAEFYVPGNGWVPADPSFCDSLCPDGSMPLYFGTVPDLNQRVALSYGFDHVVNGRSIPMLQSPAVWISGTTKVSSVQAFGNLGPASTN